MIGKRYKFWGISEKRGWRWRKCEDDDEMQASVNEHSQLKIDVVHIPVYLIREILALYLNYACTSN